MLYYISQHINNTWGFYLEPASMDLRWQDRAGNTFALRNHQILIDLLREHRPHWTEGQEFGILNEIRDLDSPNQPISTVHYAHELPPGTSKPKHATVTHCRQKECPAGCILFLQAVFLSFSLYLHF